MLSTILALHAQHNSCIPYSAQFLHSILSTILAFHAQHNSYIPCSAQLLHSLLSTILAFHAQHSSCIPCSAQFLHSLLNTIVAFHAQHNCWFAVRRRSSVHLPDETAGSVQESVQRRGPEAAELHAVVGGWPEPVRQCRRPGWQRGRVPQVDREAARHGESQRPRLQQLQEQARHVAQKRE